MMEKSIADSHTSFYIPEIQKLSFIRPHVRILGTNHCGNTRHKAFKRRSANQDVLCCSDYSERVVASFAHQIQSEYYGVNRSMYIESITLYQFCTPTHTEKSVTAQARTRHTLFYSILSDDIKQDYATTIAHRKGIIELLKQLNMMSNTLCKIWGKVDGCAKQYRRATALYLIAMFSQAFSVIIDRGVSALGPGR